MNLLYVEVHLKSLSFGLPFQPCECLIGTLLDTILIRAHTQRRLQRRQRRSAVAMMMVLQLLVLLRVMWLSSGYRDHER